MFFGKEDHCSIEEKKPMHCRFTPCPAKVDDKIKSCLYFGSGTLEEQFEHQISLSATKNYVKEVDTQYDENIFDKYYNKTKKLINDDSKLRKFCEKISPYKYIDDTKIIR